MTKNKIIRKRLLPKAIFTNALTALMLIAAVAGTAKEIKDSTNTVQQLSWGATVFLLAVFVSIIVIASHVIIAQKENEKFVANIAIKYLQNVIQEHPELKNFDKVLSEPRAMNNIATFIFNSLTKSEEKAVLQAINELTKYYYPTEENADMAMQVTCDKIAQIISEHAMVHPEFIQELTIIMARADSTYVMPTIQHTR